MAKNLLSDRAIKTARPKPTPYRLFDGDGLALWVSPTGAKSWQLRYRLNGKDQTATLGKLGRLSLAEARSRADELRKLADDGQHLTVHKKLERATRAQDAATTFGRFSAAWVSREARRAGWSAPYKEEVASSLRNHLKDLDGLPMSKVSAPLVAPILLKVEHSSPNMLEKVRRRLRAILDDAVEHGILQGNPLPATRRKRAVEKRHYPAITDLQSIGGLLRAARGSDPAKGIQRAHLLIAFTAQRVGEVVPAKWEEFDLKQGTWSIPRARMKRKDSQRGAHVVPLPSQLLADIRTWRETDGQQSVFVCPAPRDSEKPITAEAVEKHYRRALGLAGRHSPHSWRSAFSTICREAGKDGDVVEAQLDHVVGNKVASAYDRAKRLELRRELLNWYEETLLASRDGAKVHVIPKRA